MKLVTVILGGGRKQCQPPLAAGLSGRTQSHCVSRPAHRNFMECTLGLRAGPDS